MDFLNLKKILQLQSHNWIAIGVFFISLIYYLSLLHTNTAHAHDSPTYYNNIITMNISWHAHHVLYEPLSFIWAEYAKLIFPEPHPFKVISAMNSFFGAGCVCLVYLILVKFFYPKSTYMLCCDWLKFLLFKLCHYCRSLS
jgi:hypothetical protein